LLKAPAGVEVELELAVAAEPVQEPEPARLVPEEPGRLAERLLQGELEPLVPGEQSAV
jgi:hypothetical protein